jgi:tol-pal system beta propeller repeat protein TolB
VRWSAALVALAACSSSSSPTRRRDGGVARDPGGDATTIAAPAVPLPDAERAGLKGTILAAAGAENAFRVVAIEPATGVATTLTPDEGGSWYPTPNRLPLVIVTSEATGDHTEQLVMLGGRVRKVGPVTRFVRSPNLSADGNFVIYEADPNSFRDLYRLDLATDTSSRLTDEPTGSFEPSLSPDDAHVAFTSSRDGNAELYVLDLATKQTRRLTDAPSSDDWGAVWAPAGDRIAFVSDRDGAPRLHVIAPDGTGTATAHEGPARGEEASATWSPDGTRLAFTVADRAGASEIWVATLASRMAHRVSAPGARDEAPSWSPDGRHLAYVSTRDRRIDIYVARADGTAEARITDSAEEEWIPRWLP